MTTATLSSRGQIVIPAVLRKKFQFQEGDRFAFSVDEKTRAVTLEPLESWDEMTKRFTSLIKPGIPPLENPREFFNQRPPRL